jgi:hypothetical protein
MESEPEFRLPAGTRNPASGAAERRDAVCGDGEQAEDFCDHGAAILPGLVGQRRGEQFFLGIFFGMIARRWTERLPRWVMPMAMRNGAAEDLAAVVDFFRSVRRG